MAQVSSQKPLVRLRLKRGLAGCTGRQRATVRALGLRRVGATVVVPRSPAVEGRIAKVRHLVEVVE